MPAADAQITEQLRIANELKVQAPFADDAARAAEVARRVNFIKQCLKASGLKTLVLGISGGVDSLTAGLLSQRAVRELREETGDAGYQFITVRLPYRVQADEHDATASVDLIAPDERHTVNIHDAVEGLSSQIKAFDGQSEKAVDFVKGNIKARARMMAQYAIAGARGGLVVGTDHAAEAVMGFFTKFGDGACDLTPLAGLVKHQVRDVARSFGAPENLVMKVPTADLEELTPGKPDEDSHGVTYAEIDAFLHGQTVRKDAFDIICQTYRKTQHKRELPFAP